MDYLYSLTQPLFLVSALLLGAGLCAWWFYKEAQKARQQQDLWEQEQQERWKTKYEETEEGLREWMSTLGLPQLEEETRLREAAHQLRTVLSERLMKMPRVR